MTLTQLVIVKVGEFGNHGSSERGRNRPLAEGRITEYHVLLGHVYPIRRQPDRRAETTVTVIGRWCTWVLLVIDYRQI